MQHYIFDLDGTLLDSMELWAGTHRKTLEDAGIPVPENFVETITPLGNQGASEFVLSLGVPKSLEQYLEEVGRIFIYEYSHNVPLKPHVTETLMHLKQAGVGLQVLTAGHHRCADPCLKRCGIWDLFENVWSMHDFGLSKDQPEIYLAAAERLGVRPEDCVMVDDNCIALQAAKDAGLQTVGVFDRSSAGSEALMRSFAHRYIYDLAEL